MSSSKSRALDVLPYLCKAVFPAGHHRDCEAFDGEAAGDCSPEYGRHSPVHGTFLSWVVQALPSGNSNSLSDSRFISEE